MFAITALFSSTPLIHQKQVWQLLARQEVLDFPKEETERDILFILRQTEKVDKEEEFLGGAKKKKGSFHGLLT